MRGRHILHATPLGVVSLRVLPHHAAAPARTLERPLFPWFFQPRQRGFTLIEMMVVAVIMGVLAALAIPNYARVRERAMIARAIGDIKALGMDLSEYQLEQGTFPPSLADIGRAGMLDPWGQLYGYTRVSGSNRGALRKDRFLVPINSDFDLYSMGPDMKTNAALTSKAARDDIIRANDGGFVGVAANY